jgi:hypothetical protein
VLGVDTISVLPPAFSRVSSALPLAAGPPKLTAAGSSGKN